MVELPERPPRPLVQVQVDPPLNMVLLFVKVTVNSSVVVPPSSGYEPDQLPCVPLRVPVKVIPSLVTTNTSNQALTSRHQAGQPERDRGKQDEQQDYHELP